MLIDRQLAEAGWSVQDSRSLNLFAAQGVAHREATMAIGHGRVDYLLYGDQRVVGVIEAKPEGTPLSGVEWQSAMYADGLPPDVKLAALTKDGRLPLVFETSGTETHFTNGYDPRPRARRIFNFPKSATLAKTLRGKDEEHPTWRARSPRCRRWTLLPYGQRRSRRSTAPSRACASSATRWRKTLRDAGLTGIKLHDLRHFYASGLITAGCDVVTVQRSLGHAKATTALNTYAHLWPTAEDRTRKAAESIMVASLWQRATPRPQLDTSHGG